MASDTFRLIILTPYGGYADQQAAFLSVRSEDYNLGILPNHAPLISTVDICKMVVRSPRGNEEEFAIGGGVIKVEDNIVTLLLNSIERKEEINLLRAEESKKRAEERLKQSADDDAIDVSRAKAALLRAANRIRIKSNK